MNLKDHAEIHFWWGLLSMADLVELLKLLSLYAVLMGVCVWLVLFGNLGFFRSLVEHGDMLARIGLRLCGALLLFAGIAHLAVPHIRACCYTKLHVLALIHPQHERQG